MANSSSFACDQFIREIGRGARGARGLSREDACTLYAAILAGEVRDLELGAILLAYRVKGEEAQELAGMLDAVHAGINAIPLPAALPVCIPSYNGARKKPNLVPLLALLLAREGVPVLIHGITQDPGRITTAQILTGLGIPLASDLDSITGGLEDRGLAFAPIELISPALARQLALRGRLGVRNSAHTIVKMIQPFQGPALRLINYTHTAYRDTLAEYFEQADTAGPAGILLSRGTEGEAVADAALPREVEWFRAGHREVVIPTAEKSSRQAPEMPLTHELSDTVDWIGRVIDKKIEAPAAILAQVRMIKQIALAAVHSQQGPG